MQVSLHPPKYHLHLIVFLLGWLVLAGCARNTPDLHASPTGAATTGAVTTLATSSTLASASATHTASITPLSGTETPSFATPTPNPQPLITYTPWELVHDLSWSQDGTRLAVSAGDWIHIYESATLVELQTLHAGAWVVDLDYLNSELIAMADKDGALQFWQADNGNRLCTMQAHNKGANSLDVDPGGKLLASAGNDAILRIWDLTPLIEGGISPSNEEGCGIQAQAEMIGGAFAVPAVRFSPDGSLVASIDLQVVRLRDPLTQRLVRSLHAENSLFDMAFSQDGLWIATAELGNQVRIWEVSTGEVLHTLTNNEGPNRFMWRVAFSPEGIILAAGSSDGTITMWDANSGELLRTIPAHTRAVTALEFSPDGRWLASGSLDASVRMWEMSE